MCLQATLLFNAEECDHYGTCYLNKTCCWMKPKPAIECFYSSSLHLSQPGLSNPWRGGSGGKERNSARVSGRVREAQLKIPHSLKLTFMRGECDRVIEKKEAGEEEEEEEGRDDKTGQKK